MKRHGFARGIALKKSFGQHFLRDGLVSQKIVSSVSLDNNSSIMEIGCGDGALTRVIQQCPFARLWVFEIDPEWAAHVEHKLPDPRITIFIEDILESDLSQLETHKPWVLLSNLPYQITFPILYRIQEHRHLFAEGVLMMQEEVAQKIVANHGRGYGHASLFFQHYFTWTLMDKIAPTAFYPPPKVFSRLLHFRPKENVTFIPYEDQFWDFIKACFKQPRRTLKNNLAQKHYNLEKIDQNILLMRAQQMTFDELLNLWTFIRAS